MCTSGCSGEGEIKSPGPATLAKANQAIREANPGVDNPPIITASDDGKTVRFPLADNQSIEAALRKTNDQGLMALADLIAKEHAAKLAASRGATLAGYNYKPGIPNPLFTGQPHKTSSALEV